MHALNLKSFFILDFEFESKDWKMQEKFYDGTSIQHHSSTTILRLEFKYRRMGVSVGGIKILKLIV